MNRLFWYLLGYDEIEITGASPQWAINGLTQARLPFWGIRWIDPLHVRIFVFRRDRDRACREVERHMCEAACLRRVGVFQAFGGLLHRPVLLLVTAVSLAFVLLAPKFLWFYSVTGNAAVPEQQILRALQELGIGPGTYGPAIHQKWIKDHMLQQLPRLEWITVNQNGCLAQVVVRERPVQPELIDRKQYTNVIAARDGLITRQSVLSGQAVHQPGDLVLRGETLISGLVDLETRYLVQYAQGEIFARTWRPISVRTPLITLQKQPDGEKTTSLWLEAGRHRIKIFGNSGIFHASCDKMINRKILSLPGGHQLPLALVVETCRGCELTERARSLPWVQSTLESDLRQRLQGELIAGELLRLQLELHPGDRAAELQGVAECEELISRTVEAKWNKEDFEDD